MPKEFNPPAHAKRKSPYPKSKPTDQSQSQNQTRDEKPSISINDLKRRIRDAKRLLSKPDLPADKRIIQERALKGYEKELGGEEKRRERSRMIKKYHFVRFLDRKTATKEVSKLTKKQTTLTDDESIDEKTKRTKLEKLEDKLHAAKVNLNYTIYYPLTEKYISIYAERKKTQDNEDGDEDEMEVDDQEQGEGQKEGLSAVATAEKKAMWSVVERCMGDGTLDLLREGKLKLNGRGDTQGPEDAKPKTKTKTKTQDARDKKEMTKEKKNAKSSSKSDKKGKSTKLAPEPAAESGDDSDGGFFEV